MILALSLIISLALLAVLVFVLHRSQTASAKSALDRDEALPPLKTAGSNLKSLYDLSQVSDPQPSTETNRVQPPEEHESATKPQESDWLEQVMTARKDGNTEHALSLAEAALPRWGAYTQSCLILRQLLRDKGVGDGLRESTLQSLYQSAAMAEFLHQKDPSHKISQQQLLSIHGGVKGLRFTYNDVGYDKLRLIRKADIKLFHHYWGLPEQHQLPRQLHLKEWHEALG